jgi:hypothetical protein
MDTTPDWIDRKNEVSKDAFLHFRMRDLEMAHNTIKRLKAKVKDLQRRNKNLLKMIYEIGN